MPVKKQTAKNSKKTVARRAMATRPMRRGSEKSNDTKMVSFGRAISNFFRKYFQFNGVATRAEYWWIVLFLVIVSWASLLAILMIQPSNVLLAGFIALCWILFCVVVVVPTWTLMSRRLHDAGFSAKLLWISFVFFIYSLVVPEFARGSIIIDCLSFTWGIILLILFLFPSKKQGNMFRD